MPLVTSGSSRLITHRPATVTSWWLSGGISAANCIGAYAAKGAATLAASYVNLASPGTKDLTLGTAPAFDTSTGWTFTGASSQYLKTGILTTASYSAIVKFASWNRSATYKTLFGAYESATKAFLVQNSTPAATTLEVDHNAISAAVAESSTSGVYALCGGNFYANGSFVQYKAPTAGTMTRDVYIGADHGSSTVEFVTAQISSIAFYDTVLLAAQVGALTAAMP
jgi:hypothetical protein